MAKNQIIVALILGLSFIMLLGIFSCKHKDARIKDRGSEAAGEDEYLPEANSEAADSSKAAGIKAEVKPGSTIANYKYTWTDSKDIPPVVIIIDDFGQTGGQLLTDFAALPREVSFAILPDLPKTTESGKLATANGHDVLIHLPMQALASGTSPGKRFIGTDTPAADIVAMLSDFHAQLPMAIATNNHMGSAATQNETVMNAVLDYLAANHMFFIDSATSGNRLAYNLAKSKGLRSLRRDIFLDVPDNTDATIAAKIQGLGKFAGRREPIVIITHCHNRDKLTALQKFIAQIQAMGVKLISVSQAQSMA